MTIRFSAPEPAPALQIEAEVRGEEVGDLGHPGAVVVGEGALGVHHLGKGPRDIVERVVVDRPRLVRRPEVENDRVEIVAGQAPPEVGGFRDAIASSGEWFPTAAPPAPARCRWGP